MEPVTPNPDDFRLPPGTRAAVMAKDQPQYQPLPALLTPMGQVVTQWRPTADELAALNAGAPIVLVVYTFNRPLQPVSLGVGGFDLT